MRRAALAWSTRGSDAQRRKHEVHNEECETMDDKEAFVQPMSVVAFHVPERTAYTAHASVRGWLDANEGFRRDVLARLRDAGPLLLRTCRTPARCRGLDRLDENRNVTQMPELLSHRASRALPHAQVVE
jgi:hypothetical protein